MNNINAEQILTKYKDQFNSLNARIYTHSKEEEILILRWWMHLHESGDIKRLIKPSSHSVSKFFTLFAFPTTLIYSIDDEGEVDNAAWVVPEDEQSKVRTAHSGAWTRTDTRGKKKQYNFIRFFYSLMFEFFDALLGLTWQKDLLDIHTKLGYNIVGCIPDYCNQPHCYIVHLTREGFQNSRFYKVGGN